MANQPTEQAGMSTEVIQKLQEKATVLTQERKKRGRTVPEELTTQEQLKNFKTLASLIVNIFLAFKFCFINMTYYNIFRVYILLVYLEF